MDICHACGGKATPDIQHLHPRLTQPLCRACAQARLAFLTKSDSDSEEIEAAALTVLVPMLILEFIRGREHATLTVSLFEVDGLTPSPTTVH
jgi:hypothetical protein